MDVSLAIEKLVPAAEYRGSLVANTEAAFDALHWTDPRAKPTWAELLVAAEPDPILDAPHLSPPQFQFMLAYSGLDEIWDAVEAQAKASGDMGMFATLRAQRAESSYRLVKTLAFKNDPGVVYITSIVAPTADLSDTAIMNAWAISSAQTFDTVSGSV